MEKCACVNAVTWFGDDMDGNSQVKGILYGFSIFANHKVLVGCKITGLIG